MQTEVPGSRFGDPRPRCGVSRAALALALVAALAACEREAMLPGERLDARSALVTEPDGTNAARPIRLPAAERIADWGQRGMNTRNRPVHAALSAAPVEVWTTDIGQGNTRRQRIATDPVAADGRVFTMDSDAGLAATALATGAPLWSVDLTPGFDRGGGISGPGRPTNRTPAVPFSDGNSAGMVLSGCPRDYNRAFPVFTFPRRIGPGAVLPAPMRQPRHGVTHVT